MGKQDTSDILKIEAVKNIISLKTEQYQAPAL
jgi:hypothetical protein